MFGFKTKKKLLLDTAWSEAGLRCSPVSLMGVMWLNSAEVSKLGLWQHLNIAEDLPAGLCTSPVSAPDWLQIKCHSSSARKTHEELCHSMVCIGVKNSNKRDDICHGQAGISVPALSESFPWQQENGIFLLCLILACGLLPQGLCRVTGPQGRSAVLLRCFWFASHPAVTLLLPSPTAWGRWL